MSKELPRDSRSFMWLEDLRRDVAYGVRTLLRAPGFTLVAVLTLALGISAVTVIYSVLRNVALDPFPYSRSDRLVNVVLRDGSGRIIRGPYFRSEEFLDYQEQTTAFEDVVGTSQFSAHWMSDAGAERLALNWMTPNGFDFLGVPPLIGRVFDYRDVAPGAPPVAVMNHRAWVTRFGADRGVIGRTLVLDGQPYTVIGVMPPRFEWNIADLWLPAAMQRGDDPQSPRGARAFQAHLRPAVTAAEAEAQLNVIGARRAGERPNDYPPGFRFGIIPVVDWVVREFRGTLYALFGAVSLLLVIACCNVANMLLARATIREREITIRAAIGASRGRIVRQLLVESAVLACGGLVVGCLMAYGGIVALAGYMPRQGVPWETQIRLDRPVLLFALAAAAVATIAFGLFPAMQSARRDVAVGANTTARSTGDPPSDAHARRPGRRPGGALDGAAARRGIADANVRQAGEGGPGIGSEERDRRRHRISAPRTDVPRRAAAVLPGGGRTDWVHAGCLGRCTDERHAAFRRLLEPVGDSRICRTAAVGSTGHLCERAAARDGRNTRAAGARAVRPGGGETTPRGGGQRNTRENGTSAAPHSDVPYGCRPSRRCRCRLPIPLSLS